MKIFGYSLLTFFTVVFIAACESKWQKMSNQELAEKSTECVRKNPTAPGAVTACENIRKECERRREQKNYAC